MNQRHLPEITRRDFLKSPAGRKHQVLSAIIACGSNGQAPELNPDATGIGWNDYRAKTYALPERLHPTRWTADRAVDFIEKYTGRICIFSAI